MASSFVCTSCGFVGRPTVTVKGSVLIELLLWCFFIVPGIIYSIWRLSTKQQVCPKCKHPTMIPADTPMSAKLMQEHKGAVPGATEASSSTQNLMTSPVDTKKALKVVGIIALALIGLPVWYVAVPALVGWFLWKKTKLNPKAKIIIASITAAVFLSAGYAVAHANRIPTLIIVDPKDGASVQAASISIHGKVAPGRSVVKVGGQVVPHGADGSFSFDAPLPSEKNAIQITATNGGKTSTVTMNVVRIYTDAEKAEQARLKAEAEAKRQAALEAQRKAKEESDAKAKAEQAAYDASRAGKLCKQHADWTKTDCQGVADRKYWIGMTYDMLVASLGSKPDSANPSNYGSGTHWQWCWHSYTPSCFYAGSDGVVTSYN